MARKEKKTVAVVLYPGVTALDVVGSMETLLGLTTFSPFRMVTVGANTDPIQTDTSMTMIPNRAFWELPAPTVLIVPGGGDAALEAVRNDVVREYVQSAGQTAELVASIGTGSLILAVTGLLDGRKATTHWAYASSLAQTGVRYVRQRWVEDGKFVTAAGATASIDVCLHLVAKLTGESAAKRIQLVIEYDPHPPLGGIGWGRTGVGGDAEDVAADWLLDEAPYLNQSSGNTASKEQ